VLSRYIITSIDFFYKPFTRFIPLQTFRYAVSGGSNALLNLIIFYLSYTYILHAQPLVIWGFTFTPYIAAYLMALSVSFPVGFLLNKYIVFQSSRGRGPIQLLLYAALTLTTMMMHYSLLHFLIGYLGFWATPSEAGIIVVMAIFSFFFQSRITFGK
jgi:putative flippase GtrA